MQFGRIPNRLFRSFREEKIRAGPGKLARRLPVHRAEEFGERAVVGDGSPVMAGCRPYPREEEVLQIEWILVGVCSKPVLIQHLRPHFPHEGEHAHCRVVVAIRHTAGGALEAGLEGRVDALESSRKLSDIVYGKEERDEGADVLAPEGDRPDDLP